MESTSTSNNHAQNYHPYFYLSESAAKNLLQYEYKGVDNSLIYKYILSPFANYLVNRITPTWLAPNLITLMGLAIMFIAYCITAFYYMTSPSSHTATTGIPATTPVTGNEYELALSQSQRAVVPNWVFAFNALAMLLYQTLDNMDGKQARKTLSSSPLGLLFDHGCDAINSIFGSQMWIAAMDLSVSTHPWAAFVCVFSPMTLFFIATWEEYHTHVLVLPIFNGPTEGLLLAVCTMLLSFFTHPHTFWHSTSLWDTYAPKIIDTSSSWTHVELLISITLIMTIREIIFKIYAVMFQPLSNGLSKLLSLLPFFTLVLLTLLIGYMDIPLMERNFTLFLHLISALFVEMVTSMMLDHLTKQPYTCFRLILIPYGILTGLVILHQQGFLVEETSTFYFTNNNINHILDMYVAIYTTMVLVYLFIKGRIIIHEICMILGIYCFDIVTPRGPDYTAVQAVLSIFNVDNHPTSSTSNHHQPTMISPNDTSSILLSLQYNTIGESTGVPSKEKVS